MLGGSEIDSLTIGAAGAPRTIDVPVDRILDVLDRSGRVVCLTVGGILGIGYAVYDMAPIDASNFWLVGHSARYYGEVWGPNAAYVYPPPVAQLAGVLPWPIFIIPWMLLIFASIWYATRWLAAPIVIIGGIAWLVGSASDPLVYPLSLSAIGNPQAMVAAAIVMGFRRPAAWGFVLLTKIGPGVGLIWFLVRREWRSLALALGATALVALVSFVFSPGEWGSFVQFAVDNYATPSPVPVVPVSLLIRVPMALILLVWGALTDRRWTVPVAAGWSALALYEGSYLLVWAAAIPLLVSDVRTRIPDLVVPELASPLVAAD